jgi:hypothetical protein
MTDKSLQGAEARTIGSHLNGSFVGDNALIRYRLQEFSDPKAACVSSGFARRERVIGSDNLVAERHIGARAEEE